MKWNKWDSWYGGRWHADEIRYLRKLQRDGHTLSTAADLLERGPRTCAHKARELGFPFGRGTAKGDGVMVHVTLPNEIYEAFRSVGAEISATPSGLLRVLAIITARKNLFASILRLDPEDLDDG